MMWGRALQREGVCVPGGGFEVEGSLTSSGNRKKGDVAGA